ncbi:MAG: putative transport system permease protein [Frankiales bacterium]|jgi:putative ABC transport system permease protein|nr:putative transport system permease protein [Frankiales bacterium]
MIAARWLAGLVRRRPVEMMGAAVATAIAFAFLACLGAFIGDSRAHMTERALASLPVDWQIQATSGTSLATVDAAAKKLPHVRAVVDVQYVAVPALETNINGTHRTTGRAFVVALPTAYSNEFPNTLRVLVGKPAGPQLLQQTAANLGAAPGSAVIVHTPAGKPAIVVTAGVSDLLTADSFFQTVGVAAGAGPSAPPDNVLLVPPADFPRLAAGGEVIRQVHVSFDRSWLPSDPGKAFNAEVQARNHFESQLTGAALVGDNAEVSLSSAREDGLYAQLLILLLGIPGVILAAVITALVVAVRADRRRREMSLVRMRGMPVRTVVGLLAVESAVVAGVGVALGYGLARLAAHWAFGSSHVPTLWLGVAAGVAVVLSLVSHLAPVRSLLRAGAAAQPGRAIAPAIASGRPWPLRFGLDVILLAVAGLIFWLTARGGYQVVVAPEGLATTSVNYAALLAPACAWPGLALFVWRCVDFVLGRRRGRPTGDGHELVVATVRRRRRLISRSAVGLTVALAVTLSTAVFTATYRTQSRLDVALTVGADVAVKEPPSAHVSPSFGDRLAQVPGVQAVAPQQHRFAYVGADLQDLYGVDPANIAKATPLRNSFVPGTTINQALLDLRRTPDGVLLAAETLHDYQLHKGDTIRLRLQTGAQQRYTPITFHVIGNVKEWPTAPKDSFIVANAAYIAQVTGSNDVGLFLVKTNNPRATAHRIQPIVAPMGASVDDIASARSRVTTASGLAATDLSGLSRLQLGFGLILAVAMFALALLLAVLDRRRALVLLAALGATTRQRGRFLAAEARAVLVGGVIGGVVVGSAIAYLLVKVLTGIFDPAPDHATIPWGYLSLLMGLTVVTASAIVAVMGRLASRAGLSTLREL